MNLSDLIIPPWVKLVVPLAMLATVLGGGWWLKHSRDYWKQTASDRQTTIISLQQQIRSMTTAQNNQATVSDHTVTRVVQGPERIKTVIQHVHDAPIPPNCATPDLEFARTNT